MIKSLALACLLAGCAHATPAAPPASAPAPAPAAAPATTPDAEFRAHKPPPAPGVPSFSPPVPVARTLSNGARLLVVENHATPFVAIDLMIEAGDAAAPLPKAGLATFVGSLLSEGTKTRTSAQFAEQLDDLAATFVAVGSRDATQVLVTTLTDALPATVELLADAIVAPAFRPADVARTRGYLVTGLAQKSPELLALDEVARLMYGDKSTWGQPEHGTQATIQGITLADLTKFHDTYYRPTNTVISISGDVTVDDAVKLFEEKLKLWKKRPRVSVKSPKMTMPGKRSVVLVDKPGASQSQVWLFGPAVRATDPDAIPLRVASFILGGPFARLNLNIREDKGYSYGARANVTLMRELGYWAANAAVKANVTAEALGEFEKELTTFSNGQLHGDELTNARQALVQSLPSTLERNMGVAMAMARLAHDAQPLDYYRTLSGAVDRVDGAAIARVAAKYDRPERWPIVIVGPRAASEEKLKAMGLGTITVKAAPTNDRK